MWKSKTGKLERFIEVYKPFIDELKCVLGHWNQFDNVLVGQKDFSWKEWRKL